MLGWAKPYTMKNTLFSPRKGRLLSLILLLFLVCTAFVGCGSRVLSKEQLRENIAADPPADRADVVSILEAWDMPRFQSSVFTPYMQAYEGRMQAHGVTPLALARATATAYIDTRYDYVDGRDRTAVTAALLACFETCAEQLCPPLSEPQAIRDAADTSGGTYNYASMYLVSWGVPSFTTQKLMRVEAAFRSVYYKEVPASAEMARRVALSFADVLSEQGTSLSLQDKDGITDTYIRLYIQAIGDRYAVYRTKEETDMYGEEHSGAYVGIGVSMQQDTQSGALTVTKVNRNGPAATAGIQVGDVFFSVDGVPVSELGQDGTVSAVRGTEGTDVTITVLRDGEPMTFCVTRAAVQEESVVYSVTDGIGYIGISSFRENTAEQFKQAVSAMESAGVRAVIYDLRGNPGGALSAVTDMLSHLVPEGTRVASFNSHMEAVDSQDSHTFMPPAVVLCNGGTASAAELFTAALRDYATAPFNLMDVTIVGTKTYGKGVMQGQYSLYDGSSITITVAEYNPPSGVNYDGEGILPDEIIENQGSTDDQLAKAYEILRAKTGGN